MDNAPKYLGLRRRSVETFLVSVRNLHRKYSIEELAECLGLNKWHVWHIVNNPDYVPSRKLRKRLNIVLETRSRRVAVHTTDIDSAVSTLCKQFDREFLREVVDRVMTEYLYPPTPPTKLENWRI
jgi:hypothetical protein